MRLRRPRWRVVAVGSDAKRKPRNTAEAPEFAAMPPVATGRLARCGCAVAAGRRLLLETALDSMRPGGGASDPGMVSPSVYTRQAIRNFRQDQ
jgi:hypothetical protein